MLYALYEAGYYASTPLREAARLARGLGRGDGGMEVVEVDVECDSQFIFFAFKAPTR